MTTQCQKTLELIYAEKAAKLFNESWGIESSPDEISWPDLIVTAQSGKFGLEVRELYFDESSRGSREKATEKKKLKIIQGLSNAYYKNNHIPIKADFSGDISDPDSILILLTEEVPKLAEMEQKRIQDYNGCICYVRRLPNQFCEYRIWQYITDKVGWVRKIDKKLIQSAIDEKSKKLSKYRMNIADVRLLLVSDRAFNSGKGYLEIDFACNARGFNKIYYLSYPVEARSIHIACD